LLCVVEVLEHRRIPVRVEVLCFQQKLGKEGLLKELLIGKEKLLILGPIERDFS